MSTHRIVLITCLLLLTGLGVSGALAQDDATCSALQNTAFTQTGTLCATTAHGEMCLGYPSVTGALGSGAAADFASPGDTVDLALVESVSTSPADLSMTPHTWGVVLMNVEANLPVEIIETALDGKGVIYMAVGGVEVVNAAPDSQITLMEETIAVNTIADADMRVAPFALDSSTSSNVSGRIPSESTLNADAMTPDGNWIRVIFNGQPGWISRAVIDAETDLSNLTVIGPRDFTPMQSITIDSHETDDADCGNLASGLFVQGPDTVPVDIRVNGVDTRISSSVLFKANAADGTLEIFVLSGLVTLFPNDPDMTVLIPPGFKTTISLADFTFLEGTPDAPYRLLTEDELAEVNTLTQNLPPNVLHYTPPENTQTQPSGVGNAVVQVTLEEGDHDGLAAARQACANGDIPANICEILGL